MHLKSMLGNPASTMSRTLRQSANKAMQSGCRTYRTIPRAPYRSTIGAVDGARPSTSTLPKFFTNSTQATLHSPYKITAPSGRSFGSISKQFTLPNGQIGPISHSTRLSTPSSLLQKTFHLFRPLQKGNFSTRARSSHTRKHPSLRQRFSTTRSKRNTGGDAKSDSNDTSLGARMRRLSREYGWSALGVYLMLSALDFPFCYLLVRYLGTDRIGEWEEIVVSYAKSIIPESVKSTWNEWRSSMKQAEKDLTGQESVNDAADMAGWGVEEAQQRNKKDASLATQLALAYAIHKSFIFLRVPLTAAVTPKVVKVLRGWGWDIGKKTTKAAKAAKRAEIAEQRAVKASKKSSK